MSYGVSACFYLLIGLGVGMALWIGDTAGNGNDRLFQTLSAPFFWPIYLPLLLADRPSKMADQSSLHLATRQDGMGQMINQVETELESALHSLEGWAESILSGERERISELKTAWRQQADRIRELDQLLATTAVPACSTEFDLSTASAASQSDSFATSGATSLAVSALELTQSGTQAERGIENPTRMIVSERTRQENLCKLKSVRVRMYDDLMSTLAWVRELVTMIHLAKYTGAPATRAKELVQQIAAAVEGISDAIDYVK